jgi:hypothetical protein
VEEERQTIEQKWAAPGAVEQQRAEQLVLLRVEQLVLTTLPKVDQ